MSVRPPFPEVVNSSLIEDFRSCPRKCELSSFEHWKPKQESVHLVAGKAFATGLEATRKAFYIEGKPAEDAVAIGATALLADYGDFVPPEDSAKTPERMMGALVFYFDSYPLGVDTAIPIKVPGGARGIEFNFAEPLPINHPVTGNPIIYAGRSDMIADFAGGTYGFDEKTTSSLGPSWSKQWDLRSQFTAYSWAAEYGALARRLSGTVVRGVSILKTKYDTQQAITNRGQWEIERWLIQTIRDLKRMIECWETGYFDYNLDTACTNYGGCQFTILCRSNAPMDWAPSYFERRKWDPLTRTETLLLQDEL